MLLSLVLWCRFIGIRRLLRLLLCCVVEKYYYDDGVIRPEDVPVGILRRIEGSEENIYINHTSLVETAGRASLTYLSTLAVLQLDAILQNAKLSFVDKPKPGNKQQSKFEKMLGMEYSCPGIGDVQLMVGVRKRDKMKIQYCITALTPIIRSSKKSSHK